MLFISRTRLKGVDLVHFPSPFFLNTYQRRSYYVLVRASFTALLLSFISEEELSCARTRLVESEREFAGCLEIELEDASLLADLVHFLCALKDFKHCQWLALDNFAKRRNLNLPTDWNQIINSQ